MSKGPTMIPRSASEYEVLAAYPGGGEGAPGEGVGEGGPMPNPLSRSETVFSSLSPLL